MTYDLGGRWTSDRLHYVLDIGKCGEEWCGVRLNPDQSCGAIVLRLKHIAKAGTMVGLAGHLDLGPEVESYEVSVFFDNSGNVSPDKLQIQGNPKVAPSLLTRTIKFYDLLARTGDAICKADPKTP